MEFEDNVADDEWEWYIGQIFSRLIENQGKTNIKTVVEIAPGFRYKIAYALKNINFSGNLYIIDTNKDVLDYVKEKYELLLPNAKIICINEEFEYCLTKIPSQIDLLLSNHCIDDMIISEYIKNYYNKCSDTENYKNIIIDAWLELEKSDELVKEITDKVFYMFNKCFKEKQINNIIISQYESNLYFKDNATKMNEITKICFNKIKKLVIMNDEKINKILDFYPFGNDERYMGQELLNNTQNAKNWIVGNYNV